MSYKETLTRGKYWTRPLLLLEKQLIIKEEERNVRLRTEAHSLTRNITRYFISEIEEALQHHTNVIIYITGLPGTGKTESMKAIAMMIRDRTKRYVGVTPTIHFTFGFKETHEIAPRLENHDIVAQDEGEQLMGQDSTTVMHAIQNLQEITFRRNRINYVISSAHDPHRLRNACHVILEAFAGNWEDRINLLIAYSPRTGKPLGFVEVPLLSPDDPISLEHSRREEEFKRRILAQHGYTSVGINKEKLRKDVNLLIEMIFNHVIRRYEDLTEADKKLLKIYRKEILKTDLALAEITGSEHYQKRVLNETWRILQRWQLKLKVEEEEKEKKKKEEERKRVERERKREFNELIPRLVEEAARRYWHHRSVRSQQLETFFLINGVKFRENVKLAIGLTLDRIAELREESPSPSSPSHAREEAVTVIQSPVFLADDEFTVEFTIKKKVEDPSFPETVHACMLEKTRQRVSTKKLNERHVLAWHYRYCLGYTLDRICEEFGLRSKGSLTNRYESGGWMAIVEREILGHAVEDALAETYYQDFHVVAGNSEPDLMNVDESVMVEVKTRMRKVPPSADMLNVKELRHLQSGGKVELVLVTFRPGTAILEVYDVSMREKKERD